MLKDERFHTFILVAFVVFDLYLITYFLVWALVTPLQEELLPAVTEYASFFYLPHGVRVIATAVMGARAIPPLFLAEVGGNYLFWGMTDPLLLLTVSMVGGVITWVAFHGLFSFGVNSYYLNSVEKMPRLTTLLLAGLAASVLNGFVLTAILERDNAHRRGHASDGSIHCWRHDGAVVGDFADKADASLPSCGFQGLKCSHPLGWGSISAD